jgi:hypothetical protein
VERSPFRTETMRRIIFAPHTPVDRSPPRTRDPHTEALPGVLEKSEKGGPIERRRTMRTGVIPGQVVRIPCRNSRRTGPVSVPSRGIIYSEVNEG